MPQSTPLLPVDGHPGIYRKGARYIVVWRHRGRQHKRSFRTLTEASRHKAQTITGEAMPTSNVTVIDYAETWIDSYTGRTSKGLAPGTRDSYRDVIERVVVPYFAASAPRLKLRDLRPGDLRAFIDHCAAMTVAYGELDKTTKLKARRPIAPSSVRRIFAPVRAMMATAYEDGLIATNPAAGLRITVADTRPTTPKHLTPEQTRALLAAMPTEHADLAYLLAATGLRISEALGARWDGLSQDPAGPVLKVSRSTTKTDAGERVIRLTPETARMLTRRRSDAKWSADRDPIFPTAVGTPLDAHNYRQRIFNPARKAAGLPWATPHKLRHGVGTLMDAQGYTPAQIAAMLGHADGGVLAMRTYVHAAAPSVDFLDGHLSPLRAV
jgi:integrase